MKFLLSILLMFSLIACSGSKSANNAEESEAGTELAEGEEFSEDFEDDLGEFGEDDMGETEDSEVIVENDSMEEMPEEASGQESEMNDEVADSEPVESAPSPAVTIDNSEMGVHTVRKGETLMLISFKIYGDYGRWRELARANSASLGGAFRVSEGMQLQYQMPAQKFSWNPQGNPHLIRVGDTLGTISQETYGTNTYWRNIWKNNTPLIKNPNKIFAGFTIYTPVIEARGVANE